LSGSPAEQTIRNCCGYRLPASSNAVPGERGQLLLGVEAALALKDVLGRAQPPRPEERRDPRRPRPLAHAVEELALLDVVAVDELFVREQVAMRVEDSLRQSRRSRGVIELGRIIGCSVECLEAGRGVVEEPGIEQQQLVHHPALDPIGVVGGGHQHLGL
jgi:hypothetical protein